MNNDQILEFQQSISNFKLFLDCNNSLFQKYRFLYHFQKNIKMLENVVTELTYCPTSYLENGEIDKYFITETADYWFLMYSCDETERIESAPIMIDFQILIYKDLSKVCFSKVSIDSKKAHNSNLIDSINYRKMLEFYVTNGAEYRYFSRSNNMTERPELLFSNFLIDYGQLEEMEHKSFNHSVYSLKKKFKR